MKKIIAGIVFTFLLSNTLFAQSDSAIMNNNIHGVHHKNKKHGINSYTFDALSTDFTVGYGSALDNKSTTDHTTCTYAPVTGYVLGGFPVIGKETYYKSADKGLIIGYDLIAGLSYGTATHNPSTGDFYDKKSFGEVIEFGLFGIVRPDKDYDLGCKLLWGIQGNTSFVSEVRDRGWIGNINGRYRRWYLDYEQYIARSKAVEGIFGSTGDYLTYPVFHNITLKFAVSKRHYFKLHTEFAVGNHSQTTGHYPNTTTESGYYHNFFLSAGFGWFFR